MTAWLCSSARLRTSGSALAKDPNLYDTAPSPVVDGLSWKVLEFIASKPMPAAVGVRPERGRVTRIVPGHVQADGAVRAGERIERGDVVDLLLGGARLTTDGEAAEPGTAGAHCPRRRGDREARHLIDHRVGVDPGACEAPPQHVEVAFVGGDQIRLDVDDPFGVICIVIDVPLVSRSS